MSKRGRPRIGGERNKAGRLIAAQATLRAADALQPIARFAARMAALRAAGKRARECPDERWCILRTSGARTLPLARSLAVAGFEVWTPIEVERRIRPRSSAKFEVERAIMPSFVFARADTQEQVNELFRAHSLPAAHPSFSVFHSQGRVPTIKEGSLKTLRAAEEANAKDVHDAVERQINKAAKQVRRDFRHGAGVRITQEAFVGLNPVIDTCDGRYAEMQIGTFRWKIGTWHIVPDGVSMLPSSDDGAALAA